MMMLNISMMMIKLISMLMLMLMLMLILECISVECTLAAGQEEADHEILFVGFVISRTIMIVIMY